MFRDVILTEMLKIGPNIKATYSPYAKLSENPIIKLDQLIQVKPGKSIIHASCIDIDGIARSKRTQSVKVKDKKLPRLRPSARIGRRIIWLCPPAL